MTFMELAASRYSVRKYRPDPIPAEVLHNILEASRLAPTAVNYQPQHVYVVKDPEVKQKLAAVCPMRFAFRAPVVLVVCYDKNRAWNNELMPGYCSGETDAAIATTHMMLSAWEQGVGSCWVGVFNDRKIAEALALPENMVPTALLPMGYPAENSVPGPLHAQSRPLAELYTEL